MSGVDDSARGREHPALETGEPLQELDDGADGGGRDPALPDEGRVDGMLGAFELRWAAGEKSREVAR